MEESRAMSTAWKEANPEKHRASNRAYEKANPEKVRKWKREDRRLRRERLSTRETWYDARNRNKPCPLCGQPIDHALWGHDPLAPSIGHEPPCSRDEIPGYGIIRWEHLRCNKVKAKRTDAEYFATRGIVL